MVIDSSKRELRESYKAVSGQLQGRISSKNRLLNRNHDYYNQGHKIIALSPIQPKTK